MDLVPVSTRAIGRAAVRDELARRACAQLYAEGFDAVTLDELAAAAGVSRSTFLRYFGSKEEVVLFTFDPLSEAIVSALSARPAEEPDWAALRRALDPVTTRLTREPAQSLALLRLVGQTPALRNHLRDKQAGWRPLLVQALTERSGPPPTTSLVLQTRVAAAMECLMAALEHWTAEAGHRNLDGLIDQAFGAIAAPAADDSPAKRAAKYRRHLNAWHRERPW